MRSSALMFVGKRSIMAIFLVVSAICSQVEGQDLVALGEQIFFDKISSPDWMSCATCHDPKMGWTGPISGINLKGSVYRGAVPQRFGNRKPPSASYATLSPLFDFEPIEELFFGGNFWDGRATGWKLGNPAADQALGPFLNPVEQNNPSKEAVLEQIANGKYADLWEQVWGEPISFASVEDVELNYDRVGLAIEAYEASSDVNQFTSKFDFYLVGDVDLTEQEAMGMDLFNGKAQCAACHVPPLFTDFTYDNLGVPKNPDNPFYEMDTVFLDDGLPINPLGPDWIDLGLGSFLRRLAADDAWRDYPFVTEGVKSLSADQLMELAEANDGKHKVPSLRNVDKRKGNGVKKAYMHNGVFKSLKEVVEFYNTRDVDGTSWAPPEVPQNVNTDELGDLGLSDEEEDAIVAFMKALSDGYELPKK